MGTNKSKAIYGTISEYDYYTKILPYFTQMGCEVGILKQDRSGVIINALFNNLGTEVRAEVAVNYINECLHQPSILQDPHKMEYHNEGAVDWRGPAMTLEEEEAADREPVMDIFDYTELRKDPKNAKRLQEYADSPISVHRNYMVDKGKDAFGVRGWIYAGDHFGDGTIVFQSVLKDFGHGTIVVVPPESVKIELDKQQIEYRVGKRKLHPSEIVGRPEPEAEPDDSDALESAVEDYIIAPPVPEPDDDDADLQTDDEADSPEPYERPISVEAAEIERQETAADAMEEESEGLGEELTPGEAPMLELEPEEEIGIRVVPLRGAEKPMVVIELMIGGNEVSFKCRRKQALMFFSKGVKCGTELLAL